MPSPSSQPNPAADPIGELLVSQRPDVVLAGNTAPLDPRSTERVADAAAIANVLASCVAEDEDDLLFELMYLETLLSADPAKANELLAGLGELGDEVRAGLSAGGAIDMVAIRERTRRLKQHPGDTATRMTAAMLVALSAVPAVAGPASAAHHVDPNAFQIAAAPVVRVVDANTGKGIAGVQIKSMEEQLLGTTDASGQATLSEGYMDTDLLSLEKEGYQMYLLDRSQLSSRNIVSMKPIVKVASATTKAPNTTKVAVAPTPAPVATPKAPSSPVVKLPKGPKNPKVAAVATPKPAHVAAQPTPMATPHPKATSRPTTAPTLENPAKHPVQLAAHPSPAPHASATPHLMSQPVAPRHVGQPKVAAKGPIGEPIVQAPTVSVPKRMPAHRAGRASSASHYYRVKPGDTLSEIAQRELGGASRWHAIYAANRDHLHNPHWLRVGQLLVLPEGGTGASHYTVRPGDSLYTIAQRELGDGNRWHSIFEANRGHVHNPRLIFPGERLTIPR